jgi:endonuclease YncB( thermonuclease family)
MIFFALTLFLAHLLTFPAFANFSGPVVSILYGDTIEVLNGHHTNRIRLSGIDCPEKGQAFGQRAKQAASQLVLGKEGTVQTHGHDKYKRTIGEVILPDGMNFNQEEHEARDAKKGLWSDPQPVPPWEWRKGRRANE